MKRFRLLVLLVVGMSLALKADSWEQSLREQRYAVALQLLNAALKEHARDLRLITARGLALAGLQRTNESMGTFESALRINPDFVPALRGAAQTGYAARDPRTMRFLKRLIELDALDATGRSMAGVLAFEAGDYRSAASHFEAGRSATEANPQASAVYGACLSKLKRTQEAALVFDRLARGDPGNTAIQRSLASAQAAAGNVEGAVDTLKKAVDLKPEEESYVDLVALWILNNAPDRALQAIRAGLAELPRSARLYALRGVVEAERGLEAEAEADFRTANQLDSGQLYGAPGLGVLYADTGRASEASAVLRKRLKKSPSDPTLNYLFAAALVREGAPPGSPQFRESKTALMDAIRVRPGYVAAHTALGKLYKESNDYVRATAEFRLALELDGSNRAALNQLANLLRLSGNSDEAAALTSRLRQVVIGSLDHHK